MIEIKYLQAESGANKFGTCNCCGKSSGEDPLMISIKFSYYGHGTLICLCDDCKKKLIEALPPANISEIPNSYDTISRAKAIEALKSCYCGGEDSCGEPWIYENSAIDAIKQLLPAQPEPSQVAKDIARIVGNEQDMRVIRPEIIYCKDCKKQNRHYHESPYKDTVCPLTAWRGTAQGHEYDYQFCCFAERREVTECLD